MAAVKFEGVDVLDALGQIMELHTLHYKDDFELDKELIPKLALSTLPEDKHLLWMSRPYGTYTLRERDTYLEGTFEHNTWKFYHEQTKDSILAYALSLDGMQEGKVIGTIYPLDYGSHVEHIKQLTCPIAKVTVTFADGFVATLPYESRRRQMNELMPKHGSPKSMFYEPESERELAVILKRERFKRDYHAVPRDFKEYIRRLEKDSVREQIKDARTVVTAYPHGTLGKDGPEL